jgi:hypothetical protein
MIHLIIKEKNKKKRGKSIDPEKRIGRKTSPIKRENRVGIDSSTKNQLLKSKKKSFQKRKFKRI